MMKKPIALLAVLIVLLLTTGIAMAVTIPTVDFTASTETGSYPLTVTFTVMTTGMTPPLSYEWDFGDNSGAERLSGTTITHTYQNPGKYTVRVAANDLGVPTTYWVSATKTDFIYVTHVPPVAGFTRVPAGPSPGMAPTEIHFTSTTTGSEYTLYWDFGDGEVSTDTNPVHVYTDTGTYLINLTATNDGGSDSCTDTVEIRKPKPDASFVATSPTEGQVPLAVQFLDTSTGEGPFTYHWLFGDGQTSDVQNPLHAYGSIGRYTVNLIISNDPARDLDDDTETKINYINVTEVTGPIVCPEPTVCPAPPLCPVPIPRGTSYGEFRNGMWFLNGDSFIYGQYGDTPLLGDWDGDGITTVGVYRNGYFFLRNTNTGGVADVVFTYGNPTGDLPVVGDWDGNGTVTIGVNRGGVLYLRNSNSNGVADIISGQFMDVPVIG
jgi:PKD repeat protein